MRQYGDIMELSEVKQLTHRVVKIDIENKNFYSLYNYITQKITVSDVSEEEVIRFSLEENSNFIQHQSYGSEYYIIIPNNLNSITSIYIHYFPAELYEYEEDQNIFWDFNFQTLLQEEPVNGWGNKYPVIKTINKYKMEPVGEKGLKVYSELPNSVDNKKNPNYKDITEIDIINKKDKTEQGYFPLSSRYRQNYKYFNQAPDLKNNPKWNAQEAYDTICNETPLWQVRINRDGLNPVIAETLDGEYYPISVNLNYQYLPTSTHYHQHYYGFEGECPKKDDIFVFEGTDIVDVNENFENENNFRIIKRTEPFDNTHSMFVDHKCIKPLELLACSPKEYITKNKCYDYYTYTAVGDETPSLIQSIPEGQSCSLKYFIFVPNTVDTLVEKYNQERPKEQIRETELISFTSDMTIYGIRKNVIIEDGIFKNTQNSYDGFIDYRLSNEGLWEFEFEMSIRITGTPWGQSQGVWFKDADVNTNKYVEVDCYTGFRIFDNGEIYGQNANGENVFLATLNLPSGDETYVHQITITKIDDTHLHIKAYTTNSDRYSEVTVELPRLPSIEAFHVGLRNVGNHVDAFQKDVSIQNFKKTSYIYEYSTDIMLSDCYLSVNGERISDEFLTYDKKYRNRWIYHEVPFISQGDNLIEIVGPKNNPKIEFFLTKVEIEKFLEYTPRLDYSAHGLRVTEEFDTNDNFCKNERKSLSGSTLRIPEENEESEWKLYPATNIWKQRNQLPNPKGKVFFTLGYDVEIEYDEITGNIYYSHPDDYEYYTEYNIEGKLTQYNFENTWLCYDDETGDSTYNLYASHPRSVRFYKGPNNKFDLYLSDSFENPVGYGTVEVDFVSMRDKNAESLAYAGKKDVQPDGKVYFRKIDLSDIELINNEPTKYYLRIKYTDPCIEDEPIYDYKIVYVEPLNIDIIPSVNDNEQNKRFISYEQDSNGNFILDENNKPIPIYGKDCEGYKNSEYYEDDGKQEITYENFKLHSPLIDQDTNQKYYGGVWSHYDILDKTFFKGTRVKRGGYYIYDVEAEFPLKISLKIIDRMSTGETPVIESIGYCELSVDDKVIQTTLVDQNGYADFFVDLEDIPLNKHTIKMEYYNRYWEPIKFVYFDLIICDDTTKIKPAVPILFKNFPYCPGYVKTDDSTKCKYMYLNDNEFDIYIPQDDTLLMDLDNSENHSNFKLSVYRHKPQYKNISKFTDRNSELIYTKNIYTEKDLLVFISDGLKLDTYCDLPKNETEGQHPILTAPIEKTQIETLMTNIKNHGKNPNAIMPFHNDIRTIGGDIVICPEIMCNFMLYAPIINLETINNTTNAKLINYYQNNIQKYDVRYSIVTSSLDGETRYRTHKRTFTVHYMNYIKAQNYEIYWTGKENNKPFYSDSEEDGYWKIETLKIRKTTSYQNDVKYVDDDDYINVGKIEIYQNGEMYHYIPVNSDSIKIKKKTANDNLQLRYVFEDGYHFVSIE